MCANGNADPKWVALVGDSLFPMPRRKLKARVIREQAGIADGKVLVRDHNSPDDVVLPDDADVDLAQGNVFYDRPICETQSGSVCSRPPKLVIVVDDRWEVTVVAEQTGASVRGLFNLGSDVELLRDMESPDDIPIGDSDPVLPEDGLVFRTMKQALKLVFATTAGDLEDDFDPLRTLAVVKRDVMVRLKLDESQHDQFVVTLNGDVLNENRTLKSLGFNACIVLMIERREVVKI